MVPGRKLMGPVKIHLRYMMETTKKGRLRYDFYGLSSHFGKKDETSLSVLPMTDSSDWYISKILILIA